MQTIEDAKVKRYRERHVRSGVLNLHMIIKCLFLTKREQVEITTIAVIQIMDKQFGVIRHLLLKGMRCALQSNNQQQHCEPTATYSVKIQLIASHLTLKDKNVSYSEALYVSQATQIMQANATISKHG